MTVKEAKQILDCLPPTEDSLSLRPALKSASNCKVKGVIIYEHVVAREAEKYNIPWAEMRMRMLRVFRLMNLPRVSAFNIDLKTDYVFEFPPKQDIG
jgi:hypothetical protein